MKLKSVRVGAALLGCTAAAMFSAGVASADPPDPHIPNITHNYCDSRFMGYVCDGARYPDGSFWHQWESDDWVGWHFDCVSGNEPFPAPPPPGGCDGAIPPAPPPA
ncbi:hypothetical protein MSG_01402 [Mycobacterium shigaense]|uniref:Uncharacterized protein n=1 Tax=Mycobacterium shigaense TaxID=722731 RepID=A0A1Z4EF42_9MYCO|nr:hypothetical protein B2J96_05840 [Mycobacterium shigaense]BAX91559.1 hypothetical protein MSG_01402 [Mycobacterium shigaense]